MCTNPQTSTGQDGHALTYACRVCNDCIAARKNDWVARCMAEKATSAQALCLTLTYRNNPDGTAPDGAKAFNYKDVQKFLKLLRKRYKEKYHAQTEISYIVAGELGSKKGRVHWHMILFAARPLMVLGRWSDKDYKPLQGPDTSPKNRNHWTLWPHGHINALTPDQGGMSYVLKYALKDQFNVVKSRGTAREAKSENHGASYFRMSKVPPIGQRYLERKCDKLEGQLNVLPTLQLKIPGYKGYWWPKGKYRELLVTRFHEINERSNQEKGRDCPQWNTLLSSVSEEKNLTDWEGLVYGPEEPEPEEWDRWQWDAHLKRPEADIRKKCGGIKPCADCRTTLTATERRAFKGWYERQFEAQKAQVASDLNGPAANQSFDRWYRAKRQCNPFCQERVHRTKDPFAPESA